jgi:hypothetical protein
MSARAIPSPRHLPVVAIVHLARPAGVKFGKVQMFLAKGTPTPSAETGAVYFLGGDADQLYEFHRANGVFHKIS